MNEKKPNRQNDQRRYDRQKPAGPHRDSWTRYANGPKPAGRRYDAPQRTKTTAEPEGIASRRAALTVIREVTEKGRWASLSLNEVLTKSGLNVQDRHLATRLAYDTIGNLTRLDWALNQLIAKPDTDIRLRNVLRLGACQLMLEDGISEYAACNTSAHLCKEIGLEGLAGVCNGILRNLIRKKDELKWPDPETEPLLARAVRFSVPEWLVRRLDEDWGTACTDALLAGDFQESVTVRPNLLRLTDEQFETLLNRKAWQWGKGRLPHAYRIRGMADLGSDADFQRGYFSIQGEGSMMACYAMDVKLGMQVLDLCAAPGGKSCFLSELMQDTGRIQAWDVHPHRKELIAAQAERLKLENIRPMARDASEFREDYVNTKDAILLDAPCTGLGNLGDKPDLKLRLKEEDLHSLLALQAKILDTCAPYLKKGGTLVYSTCSVLKEENEQQVRSFLERHPEFELIPLPETIPADLRSKEEIGLQLLPHRDGMSGFYLARMRRKRK